MYVSFWERIGSSWALVSSPDAMMGTRDEDRFFKVRRAGQSATDYYLSPSEYFMHAKKRGMDITSEVMAFAVQKWEDRTQTTCTVGPDPDDNDEEEEEDEQDNEYDEANNASEEHESIQLSSTC